MRGSVVSRERLVQDHLVHRQVGDRLAQARILLLQVLKTLGLVDLQAPVLPAPAVVALLRDRETFTDQANLLALRQPHLGVPQHRDDLF